MALRFVKSFAAACAGLNRLENLMRVYFTKLIQDEAGVTAIEYGLIAALIAIAAIAAFTAVGTTLSSTFSYIATKL